MSEENSVSQTQLYNIVVDVVNYTEEVKEVIQEIKEDVKEEVKEVVQEIKNEVKKGCCIIF